jgi:dTDP-4-amino-4,6-dideoxygalactose transaminase
MPHETTAVASSAVLTSPTSKSRELAPVPLLDLSREFAAIRVEVMDAIEAVLSTQKYILGPAVDAFEREAEAALQVKHALGCASGTDALWLALAALEIGPGDAVISTPFSFFATVSSVLRAGAQPLLADIDPLTYNLSPEATHEAIIAHERSGAASKIKGIQPVHLYGQCADMDGFKNLAETFGVKIVEDAAQAWGASWRYASGETKLAGGLGDAAAFSFYPTKNLSAMGDAGMATTDDDAVAERLHMLRAHGMRKRYYHDEVGWNCRLDSVQAAVLSIKLRRVKAGNDRRREIAALYGKLFREAELAAPAGSWDIANGIVLPYTDQRATHVFHQYVVRVPDRERLREHLGKLHIGSEIFYPLPLHLQTSLAHLGYREGQFPVAERAAKEVLALPIYPDLRDDEAATVVEAIRRFYR